VDVACCVGRAEPDAQHLALRAAPVPCVALRDIENSLLNRRPDSAAAIAECRIAVEELEGCRDDAFGNKAVNFAVSSASVVCAELNHFPLVRSMLAMIRSAISLALVRADATACELLLLASD